VFGWRLAFFGLDFAINLGVGEFLPARSRDLVLLDGEVGVGAFDRLAIVGTNADALAEEVKLICIRGIPDGGEKGVSTELAPLKEVAHGVIANRCRPVVDKCCVGPVGDEGDEVMMAGGMGRCNGIG
jgi:hypothetical protein